MVRNNVAVTAGARSPFAECLHALLDRTDFYTRAQWAHFLDVSPPAVSQWVNDRTLPRADLLGMVVDVLRIRGGEKAREHLDRFDRMAELSSTEVSPLGVRMAPNVKAYIDGASLTSLGRSMRDLCPAEQQQVLSGSWGRFGAAAPVSLWPPQVAGAHVMSGFEPLRVREVGSVHQDLLPQVTRLLPSGKEERCLSEAVILESPRAVISAGPGTGKTMMMATLARTHAAIGKPTPILMKGMAFCSTRSAAPPEAGTLEVGTLVLIDAFDEVPAPERCQAAEGIFELSSRHPDVTVVVASRPTPELAVLKGFERFSLGRLSHLQMVRTVMRSLDERPEENPSLVEVKRFLCHFSEKEDLQQSLRHPLFLDRAWKLFRNNAVTPFWETHTLAECIRGLLGRDAASGVARCREPWTSTERLAELAGEIAYKSLIAVKPVFTDVEVANWIGTRYPAVDAARLSWYLAELGVLSVLDRRFRFSEEVVRKHLSASHVVKGCDGALAYLGDWKTRPDLRQVLRMACGITNDATALLNGILAAREVQDAARFSLLAEILAQPIAADQGVLAECCGAVVGWLTEELQDWSVSDTGGQMAPDAEVYWRLAAEGRPIGGSRCAVRNALAAVHRARSGPACEALRQQFRSASSEVLPAFAECMGVEGRLDLQFMQDGAAEGLTAVVNDLRLH